MLESILSLGVEERKEGAEGAKYRRYISYGDRSSWLREKFEHHSPNGVSLITSHYDDQLTGL